MSLLKKPEPEKDEKGFRYLSEKYISKLCEYNGGYFKPEYNFTCYLHFIGFTKIQSLDNFYNLRVLYLDNNIISKIEGLDKLVNLSLLYLQNNFISKIENLENNKQLVTLNLSSNKIKTIENLSTLTQLDNLYLAKNRLSTPDDIKGLLECKSLTLIDLQFNQIDDQPNEIVELLSQLTELKVLYFKGNDIIRKIQNYRKTMIVKLPHLRHLDDRAIKGVDRVGAVAFMDKGRDAETEARREYVAKNDKVREIREREKEMMKISFEDRKKAALGSLEREYNKRKRELEEKKRLLEQEAYDGKNDDYNLRLMSIEYQLEENENFKTQEEKIITLTISKRERNNQDINFEYEEWMDKIVEISVIENLMDFERALKVIHKIFREKGVQNWELFSMLDLRIKWTEMELCKFRLCEEQRDFYYLTKEEMFPQEDVIRLQKKEEEKKIESEKYRLRREQRKIEQREEAKKFARSINCEIEPELNQIPIKEEKINEKEILKGVMKNEIFENDKEMEMNNEYREMDELD